MRRRRFAAKGAARALALLAAAACAAGAAAADVRSITVAGFDSEPAEGSGYGASFEETAIVGFGSWSLVAGLGHSVRDGAPFATSGSVGAAIVWAPGWYSTFQYAGTVSHSGDPFANRIAVDANRETDRFLASLRLRADLGGAEPAVLASASCRLEPLPAFAAAATASASLQLEGAADANAGAWGYLEYRPAALEFRLGGSAETFGRDAPRPLAYSILGRIGFRFSEEASLALDGQAFFGDRDAGRWAARLVFDVRTKGRRRTPRGSP